MVISDTLEDAKVYLQEIKKKYKFARANFDRVEAAELQASLAKCSGKLEICKKDFNRVIKNQSRNISEGMRVGADTILQEQMLWDAAIGYMLVRDALFALRTINSYNSAAHAYEMLDTAMKQIAGGNGGLSRFVHIGSPKERNAYGYVTSAAAVKNKEELLDTFFERLKVTGDIEMCLEEIRNPATRQAELRNAYTKGIIAPDLQGKDTTLVSEMDEYMNRLNNLPDTPTEHAFEDSLDSMMDIHPPKDVL